MKIFNWVQRRWNPNIVLSKDGQGRSIIKKCEETPSPVFNDDNGWKDGILTIGTLGLSCDPLTPFIHHQNQNVFEEYEDGHQHHYNCRQFEQQHEEAGQLPCQYLRVTSMNYDDDGDGDTDNESEEDEEVNPLISTTLEQNDYLEWTATNIPAAEDDEMMMEKMITKKRTTLADLFSADSDYWKTHSINMKSKDGGQALGKSNSGKKQASAKTKSVTFAKKLIQPVGENSRPIKKIRGLMKKMLKRKIHPELENKITADHQLGNESNIIKDTNTSGFLTSSKKRIEGGGDESLSLLPPYSDPIM